MPESHARMTVNPVYQWRNSAVWTTKKRLQTAFGRRRLGPVFRQNPESDNQEPEGMAKMSKKFSRKLLAAALVAGVAGTAGVALAQDSSAKWTQLQEAVRLAEICRGVTHDAATWRTLATKMDVMVNHEIGGGERLTLIETAKTDARVLATKKGCDSADAQALLKDYDTLVGS
ncbi:MAG: hypothetical protein R3D05_16550 [Dongiaceae bacterium]